MVTLQFDSDDTALPGAAVPANYLPAALSALQGQAKGAHMLVAQADGADLGAVTGADLSAPGGLAPLIGDGVALLGPRAAPGDAVPDRDIPQDGGTGALPVVAIIDSGIAFWNRRFRDTGAPQFRRIAYLPAGPGAGPILDARAIADLCAQADAPGGQRRVVQQIAARAPDSVYGHGQQDSDFAHGTAMADLVLRGTQTAAVGIDLPAAVLLDPAGNALEAVLRRALRTAARLARAVAREAGHDAADLKVLLAWGYTGGPHDGRHDVARILEAALNDAGRAGLQVVVPMGNHLQQRLHARIAAPDDGGDSDPLTWLVPVDDGSANTVEIHVSGSGFPHLSLTAPDGGVARLTPQPGRIYRLMRHGAVIGAVWGRRGGPLRLTLAPTRRTPGGAPVAPGGAWQLRFGGMVGALDLWILRDDAPPFYQRRPFRQSHFADAAYVARGRSGAPLIDDPHPPQTRLRRRGTASVLTTTGHPAVTSVAALERQGPRTPRAWYCGQAYANGADADADAFAVADQKRPGGGTRCLGNGGPRRFRVSGSSVAAAIHLSTLLRNAAAPTG